MGTEWLVMDNRMIESHRVKLVVLATVESLFTSQTVVTHLLRWQTARRVPQSHHTELVTVCAITVREAMPLPSSSPLCEMVTAFCTYHYVTTFVIH